MDYKISERAKKVTLGTAVLGLIFLIIGFFQQKDFVYAKKIDGVWFDVGSPSELIRAQQVLISGRDSLPFPMPKGQLIGSNGFEFENSESSGNNRGSVVSKGVIIGVNSVISDSLIMSNSVVGTDCEIDKSVIGENVSIGDSCKLHNCVIGDNVIVKDNTVLNDSKLDF